MVGERATLVSSLPCPWRARPRRSASRLPARESTCAHCVARFMGWAKPLRKRYLRTPRHARGRRDHGADVSTQEDVAAREKPSWLLTPNPPTPAPQGSVVHFQIPDVEPRSA